MGDLFVYGAVRLPFDYKKFRFPAELGDVFLPTANNEPEKPSHTVTDSYNEWYYTVNYHYNLKNGNGVISGRSQHQQSSVFKVCS